MSATQTDRTTIPAPASRSLPSLLASAAPTLPHLSLSRAEGMAWYCAVMARATGNGASDVARFAAGL